MTLSAHVRRKLLERAILLIHGQADEALPAAISQRVYQIAREPKRLIGYSRADHVLDAVAGEISQVVHDWIVERLKEHTPAYAVRLS